MMLLTAILAVSLQGSAGAAPPPGTVRSWTGIEARPDFAGNPLLRAEEQLSAQVALAPGWSLEGMGAVRDPAALSGRSQWDLLRLSGHYARRDLALGAGRLLRTGIQGMEPLDGAVLLLGEPGVQVETWTGRLWHPELLRPRELWVLGAESRLRPDQVPGLEGGFGGEARVGTGSSEARGFASLSWEGPKRGQLGAVGEVATTAFAEAAGGDADPAARASLRASRSLGRRARLGGNLRWEELLPAGAVAPGPLQWLAPEGYGVAELDGQADLNLLRLSTTAGPTWRPDADGLGGWGRLGLEVPVGRQLFVGGTALGAQAAESAVAGGLVHAGILGQRGILRTELGRYRFQAQTGPVARPWEARLTGELAPWSTRGPWARALALQALSLRSLVSVGADRTLSPWLRGGLVLVGDFGGGGA